MFFAFSEEDGKTVGCLASCIVTVCSASNQCTVQAIGGSKIYLAEIGVEVRSCNVL